MIHRTRRRAVPSDAERRFFELAARLDGRVPQEVERMRAKLEHAAPAPVVDDFLPPELRLPSHDQLSTAG